MVMSGGAPKTNNHKLYKIVTKMHDMESVSSMGTVGHDQVAHGGACWAQIVAFLNQPTTSLPEFGRAPTLSLLEHDEL